MHQGLNSATSIGRCGQFLKGVGDRTIGLPTAVLHDETLFTWGRNGTPVGRAYAGERVLSELKHRSWTGLTIAVEGDAARYDLHARTTLPGIMYELKGQTFAYDWAMPSSPLELESLPDGQLRKGWQTITDLPQLLLIQTKDAPILLVCSAQPESVEIISHEHWRFRFAQAGERIMFVPLLDADDAPRSAAAAQDWLTLMAAPPLVCAESYECHDKRVRITAAYTGVDGKAAACAPLPPVQPLAAHHGLVELPEQHRVLCKTVFGPFSVCTGSAYTYSIAMDWAEAKIVPQNASLAQDGELPFELAYAGDASWDETEPMDQLLSYRIWAPLAGAMAPQLWEALKQRVALPTPEAFKKHVAIYTEPVSGLQWAKDNNLFGQCGEVSYDTDWYTGLTLSGLRRAADCSDATIAKEAAELAASIADERALMINYYSIFSDWALAAAWTDVRGVLQNYDCAHNGLEGILAEMHFCRASGDQAGADHACYLAARAAQVFIAMMELPYYRQPEKGDEAGIGFASVDEWRETHPIMLDGKSQYHLAGDFPEFCALLKCYGPLERLRAYAEVQRQSVTARYQDWLAHYVGAEKAAKIRNNSNDMGFTQEAREQAAIFYSVASDVAMRLWILEEDPASVESMWDVVLPLAYQIQCRGQFALKY